MWRWHLSTRVGPVVMAVLAIGLAIPATATQEPPAWFSFHIEGSDKKTATGNLDLRPNTPHIVEVWLTNVDPLNDGEPLKDVVVKLVNTSNGRTLATAKVDHLTAKESKRLAFAIDKEDAKKEWPGPRQALELWLEKGKTVLKKQPVIVKIKPPTDYISAKGKYDSDARRLSVEVAMKEGIPGPQKCAVALVLDPLYNPGLKDKLRGARKQTLTVPAKGEILAYAKLEAEDLEFDAGRDFSKDTRIFLTVDGYERAFEFRFNNQGDLLDSTYNKDVAVRFRAPRYASPTPLLPLTLHIDGRIDEPMRVELGFQRSGKKAEDQFQHNTQILQGLRDVRLRVGTSDAGDLSLQTLVQDWKVNLDTDGVLSRSWLRVRVLEDVKGDTEKPLSRLALEPLTALADDRFAELELDKQEKRLYAAITFDATPPEDVKIIVPSKAWLLGQSLVLKATVKTRDEEREAPIEKAIFYYGQPDKDKKIPPDAVKKEGEYDPKTGQWSAELPAVDKEGDHRVSVQFVTLTGKSDGKTAVAVATKPIPADKQPATVKGTLYHGSDPQADLYVYLLDAKKYAENAKDAVIDTVKSGPKGQFEFAKVLPGDYVLAASKVTPPLVGRTNIRVLPSGKVAALPDAKQTVENVEIRMLRK